MNDFDYNYDVSDNGINPPWIKLWVSKYVDLLDIDTLNDEYKGKELEKFLMEMGKVFLDIMYVYQHYHENEGTLIYIINDRVCKMLYKALKRDLDQTFRDYERRREVNRENGKKGGRPPQQEE